MRAIILAAGQGSRMKPLTDRTPKPLLAFNGTTVLARLISQLLEHTHDVTVVVGFQADAVTSAVRSSFGSQVNVVLNPNFKEDVNILSLNIGLKGDSSPFVVFEADCLYEDECIKRVFSPDSDENSSWFTIGDYKSPQCGGILKANEHMFVEDIRILTEYDDKFKEYKKLIGILKVGPNEVKDYIEKLNKSVIKNTKQYYLQPWIENLSILPCKVTELGDLIVGAFNSPEEYYEVLKKFESVYE